jgi:hypothetical protein
MFFSEYFSQKQFWRFALKIQQKIHTCICLQKIEVLAKNSGHNTNRWKKVIFGVVAFRDTWLHTWQFFNFELSQKKQSHLKSF